MKIFVIFVAVLFFASCSCFSPSRQTISVMTNVNGAEIFADGELKGYGNASFSLKKNKSHEIMVKADGYYPAYRSISNQLSTTGILDIIGIFVWIVPFIGLLTPGAKTLDTDSVAIQLNPVK